MKVIERKIPTEREMIAMSKNPRLLVNRWRGRLRKSADALAKIKDPVERRKRERQFYLQKKHLAELEAKAKRS